MNDEYQDISNGQPPYDDATDDVYGYEAYEDDSLQPLLQTEEDYLHGIPLLSWMGPGDLPEEENRRWFMLIILIDLVFFFIAILTKNFLLTVILMLVSVLTYMLSRVPSQELEHTITSTGVFTNNKFYPWNELSSFWLIKDRGHYVLGLETSRRFFASEHMLLGNQNPMEIKEVLLQFLPQNENKEQDAINNGLDKVASLVDTGVQAFKERFLTKSPTTTDSTDSIEQIIASTEEDTASGVQEQLIVEDEAPETTTTESAAEPSPPADSSEVEDETTPEETTDDDQPDEDTTEDEPQEEPEEPKKKPKKAKKAKSSK